MFYHFVYKDDKKEGELQAGWFICSKLRLSSILFFPVTSSYIVINYIYRWFIVAFKFGLNGNNKKMIRYNQIHFTSSCNV